jgi:hypothetical protein
LLVWTVTSWGTVISHAFEHPQGIAHFLLQLLSSRRGASRLEVGFRPGDVPSANQGGSSRISMLYEAACRALDDSEDCERRMFVMSLGGDAYILKWARDGSTVLGPLDDTQVRDELGRAGPQPARVVVDPGSVRLSPLAEALRRTPPGDARAFLFRSGTSPGLAVVDRNRTVFWGAKSAAEGAWLLAHTRTPGLPPATCLDRDEDGRWVESAPPTLSGHAPDVVVDGELTDSSSLAYRVAGIEDAVAPTAEQAATWLLSRWSVGKERQPRLVLGTVRIRGAEPSLVEKLNHRRRLAEWLDAICSAVMARTARKAQVGRRRADDTQGAQVEALPSPGERRSSQDGS